MLNEIQAFREGLENYNNIEYSNTYINKNSEAIRTIAHYKYQNSIPMKSFNIYYKPKTPLEQVFYVLKINGKWFSSDSDFNVSSDKDNLIIISKRVEKNVSVSFNTDLRQLLETGEFDIYPYSSEISDVNDLLLFQKFYDFLVKNEYPIVNDSTYQF